MPNIQAPAGNKIENQPASKPQSPQEVAVVKLPSSSTKPVSAKVAQDAPPPPTESKPDVKAALASPPSAEHVVANVAPAQSVPTAPKSGRIVPAVPLPGAAVKGTKATNGTLKSSTSTMSQAVAQPAPTKVVSKTIEDANRDARAAVAIAMAKLPPAPGQKKAPEGGAMDNLTRKVAEMRTNDDHRPVRQPGTGEYVANQRGRGGNRGGRANGEQPGRKVEVPKTDYDFETANAKFNKQDLVKEAIATGSPAATPGDGQMSPVDAEVNGSRKGSESTVVIPAGVSYNKNSSFFDNISSESKDRNGDGGQRLGGREFRTEERQKNLETFGQGSVDNNYRSGYGRGGRGRGRGFGRARGARGGAEGRGGRNGFRGGQGNAAEA